MAASTLPAPGTEYGPCLDPCLHRDCVETRRMALARCDFCGDPIGYDVRYYRTDTGNDYAHAPCLETAIEEGRA